MPPSGGPEPAGQAVNLADVPDESEAITFDTTAFATQQTITLDGSPLVLGNTSGSETIAGPASGVTISGGGQSRVFQVDGGVTATLSGLTITGGERSGANAEMGGGSPTMKGRLRRP